MGWEIIRSDCVEAMKAMDDCSVDAVVCDPPYGLEFMGKDWDRFKPADSKLRTRIDGRTNGSAKSTVTTPEAYRAGPPFQTWCEAWATEALRVLKPGGHLLAFGGTRTCHRLAAGVDDAGFEIRDTISWMYGSGFPKSLNVAKAIQGPDKTGEPLPPEAERWQGWGTALKPAHEPIVVARKPLSGTVAGNVLEHGTGALNVGGCRVGTEGGTTREGKPTHLSPSGAFTTGHDIATIDGGRWPANVVLSHTEGCVQVGVRKVKGVQRAAGSPGFGADRDDGYELGTGAEFGPEGTAPVWECAPECPVRLLDEQTGELHSQDPATRAGASPVQGVTGFSTGRAVAYPDTGGASRFFYCAKSSRQERNAGLEAFEEKWSPTMGGGIGAVPHDEDIAAPKRNVHPTVKPIELMRWLVRLVTPPGGTVLDPFAGSGTTGCAAVLEGFDFTGIEREDEYADIAEARIRWWAKHRGDGQAAAVLAAGNVRDAVEATGQSSLFDEAV